MVDVKSNNFSAFIQDGLRRAYTAAFLKSYSNFLNNNNQALQPSLVTDGIDVNMVNISFTGDTNADKSKNQVLLTYYLADSATGSAVPAKLSADSINILSPQEMSSYLNQEIVDNGYVQSMPRTPASSTNRDLWIIGKIFRFSGKT